MSKRGNTGKVGAVILAGGRGERVGKCQKQFFLLNGRPILFYSLDIFLDCPSVSVIVVVVPKDKVSYTRQLIARAYPRKDIIVIPGGSTRRHSSYAGLRFLREKDDGYRYVVFHDGVRPLLSVEMVESAVAGARKYGAVVLGSQVLNVIAEVRGGIIRTALHPKYVYNTQTPHCYRLDWIIGAHEAEVNQGTSRETYENIELVHAFGKKIRVIDSFYRNMKLTFPQDIIALEALLKKSFKKGFFELPGKSR